jgi:hypothetical protein
VPDRRRRLSHDGRRAKVAAENVTTGQRSALMTVMMTDGRFAVRYLSSRLAGEQRGEMFRLDFERRERRRVHLPVRRWPAQSALMSRGGGGNYPAH